MLPYSSRDPRHANSMNRLVAGRFVFLLGCRFVVDHSIFSCSLMLKRSPRSLGLNWLLWNFFITSRSPKAFDKNSDVVGSFKRKTRCTLKLLKNVSFLSVP